MVINTYGNNYYLLVLVRTLMLAIENRFFWKISIGKFWQKVQWWIFILIWRFPFPFPISLSISNSISNNFGFPILEIKITSLSIKILRISVLLSKYRIVAYAVPWGFKSNMFSYKQQKRAWPTDRAPASYRFCVFVIPYNSFCLKECLLVGSLGLHRRR